MQKGTGFYKFVSVCYFILAAIFSVCFAAAALAWILLIIASGMLEGGMTFVINGGCIMVLSILMGILMLHIHAGCILWDLEKRDKVVYTDNGGITYLYQVMYRNRGTISLIQISFSLDIV